MKIAIGADHAGFELKEDLRRKLVADGHEVVDYGTDSPESVDYPDYAASVANDVAAGRCDRGVLVCSTGVGMSIAANKVPGIRAAVSLEIRRQSVSYAGGACWLMVARDVSSELAARAKAEREAARAAALAGAADPVCVVDPEGRVPDANAAFSTLTGYVRDETVALSLSEPENAPDGDATVRGAALGGSPGLALYEACWKRKDGSALFVDIASSVLESPQDARVLVARDAAPRKRLEARSRAELQRTARLLDMPSARIRSPRMRS